MLIFQLLKEVSIFMSNLNELQLIDERTVLSKDFKMYGTVEDPLFLAKDVAEWIDYSKDSKGNYNVSIMLKSVDDTEKIKVNVNLNNVKVWSNTWFLTEDGLYEVLMQSRKPIAKQFKKEVKNILKTIRKTGGYYNGNNSTTSLVTITPEIAERLLKSNVNNRPINTSRVKALAQDMALGKWGLNGETIKIYNDGTLADGQHRLSACVMSGVPFQTYIVRNLQKEVLPTIDCGEKRSLVHSLKMKGIDIDPKLSPTFNLLFNKGCKLTPSQTEVLFAKYNDECKIVTDTLPRSNIDFRSKSPFRAFCLYLLIVKHFSKKQFDTFVNGMAEKPTCITNFEQTCFYYRRWYEKNIFGKRAIGSGGFNKSNLRIREIDGLLWCLDSFENETLIEKFRYTGRGMCELEKCSQLAKSDFALIENQNKVLALTK